MEEVVRRNLPESELDLKFHYKISKREEKMSQIFELRRPKFYRGLSLL